MHSSRFNMSGSGTASFVGSPLQGLFFMSGSGTASFVGEDLTAVDDDPFILLIE